MKTVYKYPLIIGKCIDVWMPAGATILCAAMQDGALMLWAEVEDSAPQERRTFSTFGTGQFIPDNIVFTYIATIFDGGYVWHVYEQT